jgi:pimeloyl-ACP methyl ester carboxylesterase
MQAELISAVPGAVAGTRIVLIPGVNQLPEELRAAGFPAAIHERRLDIDMVLVAPELAHLTDRSALTRLHAEVVEPARSSGCVTIWLAGISMGGYLALLYAADHPTELDGVCLLAPYLGNRMINAEINRFPSLASWNTGVPDTRDELPRLAPVHYLGFGSDDRFAEGQRLLASQLPRGAVDVIDGGHDWRVWRQLWDRFLDRLTGPAPRFT